MKTLKSRPLLPAIPTEPIARLTVEQYHEMIRHGILADDDPIELLEGWLVIRSRKTPPHTYATHSCRAGLKDILPVDWMVHTYDPITTDESEPEPDVSVVRGKPRRYVDHHPRPSDVSLAIEVAESSLDRDRTLKKRIYARAHIPVYWIVNLIDRQVEVYTDPTGPAAEPDYRHRQDYQPGDTVPVIIDGQEVGRLAVSDLLP